MRKSNLQLNLFDKIEITKLSSAKKKERFDNYCIDDYIFDVENSGLKKTWDCICDYVIKYGQNRKLLNIDNFGEIYELGLAHVDKNKKKNSGQYFTPDDVAIVMSEWFKNTNGFNVCDVACGTGKLILTYLNLLGKNEALKLISEGRLFLYDIDNIALKICKTSIMLKYGIELEKDIHSICCDFLDRNITLPKNSKVISNPPYAGVIELKSNWAMTDVLQDTKEYYSLFMEKILNQSVSAVIITPFSFVSGNKFFSLRELLCDYGNGFIVSFDNVPGNIFWGRKHGIFNTNTSNSVRASITVVNKSDKKGIKVSPLIRFKNAERSKLLLPNVLENILPNNYQLVDTNNTTFKKIDKNLINVFEKWNKDSFFTVKDLIEKEQSNYIIDIPNTCRYYTTASHRKLNRSGAITINIKNEDTFNFLYCFINSSFAYWWWRIYDGGITYPIGLFNKLPVPYNLLNNEDKRFFSITCKEMIGNESKYIIKKFNAGTKQENIKFPTEYRKKINKKILDILEIEYVDDMFEMIHSNQFFMDSKAKIERRYTIDSSENLILLKLNN